VTQDTSYDLPPENALGREELIINVALTGCVHSVDDNASLPVTPAQIAADAYRCAEEGASIFHLHARDVEGHPTIDQIPIQWTVDEVRKAVPGAVVCVSCSGRHESDYIRRTNGLYIEPRPEMGSLTLGSYNAFDDIIANHPPTIQGLASIMDRRGILPELEVFDFGHINYAHYLIAHGKLHPPYWFNLFLGNLGTAPAMEWVLMNMRTLLPPMAIWAATGIGRFQYKVNRWAVNNGGQVRVGLEDSLWMDTRKEDPATNPRQVARIVAYARELGREPVSAGRVREILGMEAV